MVTSAIMGAIKDLFNSERGLIGLLLILGATTLAILGKMPVAEWETYSQIIFGVYVGGKTITGAVGMLTGKADAPADAAAKPAAPTAAPLTPASPVVTPVSPATTPGVPA